MLILLDNPVFMLTLLDNAVFVLTLLDNAVCVVALLDNAVFMLALVDTASRKTVKIVVLIREITNAYFPHSPAWFNCPH